MSPIGGVGINLALQDAVATANLLAPALATRAPTEAELAAVRKRRLLPTRVVQAVQVQVQNRLITGFLAGRTDAPLPIRLAGALPFLQRSLARGIGLGVRQEHVRTPAAS
jgi:2-polyprenyl-6-methoxyphenol hydroxylase-like FAD-dependent oxidoreductase